MQPTWRRLATGTGAVFLVVLAFLAGRVRGGGDPALREAGQAQPASAPAIVAPDDQQQQEQQQQQQQDPQFADPGTAPPTTRAS